MARLNLGALNAAMWGRAYFIQFRRLPLGEADIRTLESAIKKQAQDLFDERVSSLPDRKSRMVLVMCCLVLASYRVLGREFQDNGKAYRLVNGCVQKTFATPIRWFHRIKLWVTRDPVRTMQNGSLVREANTMFGGIMKFSQENSEQSADLIVTHCAYNQFFAEHGVQELTLIICAWDRNWMDIIDNSSRPVRTERPMTLSTGGSYCRFRHVRDGAPSSETANDIVLGRLEAVVSSR